MSPRSVIVLLCLGLIALASAANAVMDTLSFRYDRSVFASLSERQWFDPQLSWRNKWKNGDPKQGDAFPLSSTALVAVTDAWHAAKAIAIFSILLAILLPFTLVFKLPWFAWIGILFGMKLLYGVMFEGLFAHLLIR